MPIEEVVIIVTGIITLAIGFLYGLLVDKKAQDEALECPKCTGMNDGEDTECRYCQHSLQG